MLNLFRWENFHPTGFFCPKLSGVKLMKIKKLLNNNAVIVLDEYGREAIAMGKGIAFQKSAGSEIEQEKILKLFVIQDGNISDQFQQLIESIPLRYMKLAAEVIEYAQTECGKQLSESVYISLTDHLYSSIERATQGIQLKNPMLWDIKRFYPHEYEMGMYAVKKVEEDFSILLTEDEVAFIAMHFVNSKLEEDIPTVYNITKIIRDITRITQNYFHITLETNSMMYCRFATHLKFFAQRILNGKEITDEFDHQLYGILCEKYPDIIPCIDKIEEYLFHSFGMKINKDEKGYLIIHLVNLLKKQNNY